MATDWKTLCRYIRNMSKVAEYKMPPANDINQWVREAMDFSGLNQTELARRLYEKGVISSPDRSKVQKMTVARNVTAVEMIAISKITKYPSPAETKWPQTVADLLQASENADEHDVKMALEFLRRSRKHAQ